MTYDAFSRRLPEGIVSMPGVPLPEAVDETAPETVTEVRWSWVQRATDNTGRMWGLMTYRFIKEREARETTSHWEDHGWEVHLVEVTSTYRVREDGTRDLIEESWRVIER